MKKLLPFLAVFMMACSLSARAPVLSARKPTTAPTPTTVLSVWEVITITSDHVNLRDHAGVVRSTAVRGQVLSALCGPDLCYLEGRELTVFIGCTSEADGRKCLER